jgi:hypothetical protein
LQPARQLGSRYVFQFMAKLSANLLHGTVTQISCFALGFRVHLGITFHQLFETDIGRDAAPEPELADVAGDKARSQIENRSASFCLNARPTPGRDKSGRMIPWCGLGAPSNSICSMRTWS